MVILFRLFIKEFLRKAVKYFRWCESYAGITSKYYEYEKHVRDHKWSKIVSELVITEAVGLLFVVLLCLLLYKWFEHTKKTQWKDLAADEIMNERMCKLTSRSEEFTQSTQRETKMKTEGKIYGANSKILTAFDQKEEQM